MTKFNSPEGKKMLDDVFEELSAMSEEEFDAELRKFMPPEELFEMQTNSVFRSVEFLRET